MAFHLDKIISWLPELTIHHDKNICVNINNRFCTFWHHTVAYFICLCFCLPVQQYPTSSAAELTGCDSLDMSMKHSCVWNLLLVISEHFFSNILLLFFALLLLFFAILRWICTNNIHYLTDFLLAVFCRQKLLWEGLGPRSLSMWPWSF